MKQNKEKIVLGSEIMRYYVFKKYFYFLFFSMKNGNLIMEKSIQYVSVIYIIIYRPIYIGILSNKIKSPFFRGRAS